MANNTINFSENTQRSLANLPPILNVWQMEDIANSNTFGYFVNPVSNTTNTLISLTTQLSANSSGVTGLETIASNANSATITLTNFRAHTDRISGVTPFDANTVGNQLPLPPYYQNCLGTGKALTYLIYQSDGISNNAVLLGNFGSLYTSNTINPYVSILQTDLILVRNSIISGGDPPTLSSNLTPAQVAQITADIQTVNTFVYTSITQDVNFYNNSNAVMQDYNSVKGFTRPGDTEKELYELIASDKLKERL